MTRPCVDEGCPHHGTVHVCFMAFDRFRENIRVGVCAGAYDVKFTVEFINRHGWSTTRDVPPEKREYVLRWLTRHANRR